MLTRARSLFSRVFSSDTITSTIRLDESLDGDIGYDVDNSTSNSSGARSNLQYLHSHEKSKQDRSIHAMQVATSRGNIDSMKRLLNSSDLDINHRDQYGMSYLELAILMGRLDMIDLLIRYGCDLYQGNSTGHSYLYVAIETTSYKSAAVIRLLLESGCSCLRSSDISSLTSPMQVILLNAEDYLLLNAHLLLILKYHLRRMVLDDLLTLLSYLIRTNLLLCKNDEHYMLDGSKKATLRQFNHDYIVLFVKALGMRHVLRLAQKIQHTQTGSLPSFLPLTHDDILPCLNHLECSTKRVFELKHLCRLSIRQRLRNLKTSTMATVVPNPKLQEYLLYTPI